MAVTLDKRLINVTEYYRMAEAGILQPGDRLELIQGEIINMSPIGSRHAGIVDKLSKKLNGFYGDEAIVRVQNPIRVNALSEPEPDIAILRPKEEFYQTAHPRPEDVLLIIEVSDTTHEYDREIKGQLYAHAGIPEYWLVDVASKSIERFWNPGEGGYLQSELIPNSGKILLTLTGSEVSVQDMI